MNDLGVYHTALLQFDAAEKVLKRALMMTERSYEINQELYIAIIANMAEMYRAKGEIETAVLYADRLLHLLNKCFNHIYNDIKEEGKEGEGQVQGNDNAAAHFLKVKTLSPSSSTPSLSSSPSPLLIYSTKILSSLRKSQAYLILGNIISQCRHFQEGVVYTSMAFEKSLQAKHGFSYSPLLLQRGIKDIAIQKLINNAAHTQTTLDKDYLNLYYRGSPCFDEKSAADIGLNTAPSKLLKYLEERRAVERSSNSNRDENYDNCNFHSEFMKEINALYDLAVNIEKEGADGVSPMLDGMKSKTNVTGVVGLALLDLDYYYQQHLIAMKAANGGDVTKREAFRDMLGLTTR